MRLYTVYDRVAEQAAPVFCAVNDSVALRNYRGLLQQVDPVDQDSYCLYVLGEYSEDTMEIDPCVPSRVDMPQSHGTAKLGGE